MAVRNIGGQHMYKLVTGLIGLALAAVVFVALAGVGPGFSWARRNTAIAPRISLFSS